MDKVTMYDQYKKSQRHGQISLYEFTHVKPLKEEALRLKEKKQEFELIADASKKMYIYIFIFSLVAGALAYRYTSTITFPFIVALIWLMLRLFLNFSFQKATILMSLTDSEIKHKKTEISKVEATLQKEAMEDFMKSQTFTK